MQTAEHPALLHRIEKGDTMGLAQSTEMTHRVAEAVAQENLKILRKTKVFT